jgi:hypothetical protein
MTTGRATASRSTGGDFTATRVEVAEGEDLIMVDAERHSWVAVSAVEKIGAGDRLLTGRAHTDEIFLRTTGGELTDADGARIRSVRLRGDARRSGSWPRAPRGS